MPFTKYDEDSEKSAGERAPPTTYSRSKNRLPHKDDPFGDETNAEVKYKTLNWWYALAISRLFCDMS